MHFGHSPEVLSPKPWRVGRKRVHVTGNVAAQLLLFGWHRLRHMLLIACAMSANVRELLAANLGLLRCHRGKRE